MKPLLALVLFLVGTHGEYWEEIQKMETMVKDNYVASKRTIDSLESIMRNTSAEALNFLNNLDDLPIVKEVKTLGGDKCQREIVDLSDVKRSFRAQFIDIERPLAKRILDIEGIYSDLRASLSIYQSLADARLSACSINSTDCRQEVKDWLSESIHRMQCKMSPSCGGHVISKRGIFPTRICSDHEYYYNGECYTVNEEVCNHNYRSYGSRYWPSPDCSRYCVGGFHCTNLKCIDKSGVCDGRDDCGDGSDEEGCRPATISPADCSLEDGRYLCSNKSSCIELWRSCDGIPDCPDGSDEGGSCGVLSCGAGCSAAGGVCLPTARGSVCLSRCPPGTEETPRGCLTGPSLPPASLSELLEDVARLTSRYLAGFKLLQNRVVDELAASLSRVSQCINRPTSLDRILKMSGYETTPHPPHTTTKRHTTTHHTTTTHRTTTKDPDIRYTWMQPEDLDY